MSTLSQLKILESKPKERMSPELFRRQRLIYSLTEQLTVVHADLDGREHGITVKRYATDGAGQRFAHDVPKRVRKWFWHDLEGNWFLEVHYGNRPLPLAAGKSVVEVGTKDKLVPVIEKLITAVRLGELDAAMKAAVAGRKKPQKKS